MTRVDFYFNVSDKSLKIIDLTHSAVDKKRRVMVYGADESQAKVISDQLWCDKPTSFLPHYLAHASMLDHTALNFASIVISTANGVEAHLHQDDVLINLHHQYPAFFSRFRQLIEVVGIDETDKIGARSRYKFYRDRGFEIKSIDTSI